MEQPRDKYDDEIDALMVYADDDDLWRKQVRRSWELATPLFAVVGGGKIAGDNVQCRGCLTQIRMTAQTRFQDHTYVAVVGGRRHPITEEIRNDTRIPATVEEIRPHHLPIMADWQRRIDREIRSVA